MWNMDSHKTHRVLLVHFTRWYSNMQTVQLYWPQAKKKPQWCHIYVMVFTSMNIFLVNDNKHDICRWLQAMIKEVCNLPMITIVNCARRLFSFQGPMVTWTCELWFCDSSSYSGRRFSLLCSNNIVHASDLAYNWSWLADQVVIVFILKETLSVYKKGNLFVLKLN